MPGRYIHFIYARQGCRFITCHQICVAPDYVIIVREKQEEFVAALKEHYRNFFPDGALKSDSYSRVVSEAHFIRLKAVLAQTKGKLVLGGQTDEKRGFEPTIVQDVAQDDPLLDEYACLSPTHRGMLLTRFLKRNLRSNSSGGSG